MGFRMIDPRRIKKAKPQSSKDILDRLQTFLTSADVSKKPVEILCRFWDDQKAAITYQELREAIKAGSISNEMLRLWQQDYSYLVKTQLNDMWKNAMKAGVTSQPLVESIAGGFIFQTQTPGVLSWLNKRGSEFVTRCTQQQKDAINALVAKKMIESHTVDELARMIRPCIGLTKGQAQANAKYYDSVVQALKKEHPKMKEESIQKRARDAAAKYAEKQHRYRAMTIAQTESAFAYNRGADEGIRQAQSHGLLGRVIKRWSTSGDDAVCSICQGLEGVELGLDEGFDFKGRLLFAEQNLMPPAHPRCACAVEYVEVEPPYEDLYLRTGFSNDLSEINVQELGEISVENTDEAVIYYNEQIRNRENESLIAIDRDGKVYYSEGSKDRVGFNGINLSGATITHNHPISNGIVSFGKDDFVFLQENQDIKKLVAVNALDTYMVQVLNDISEISYSDYYRKAMAEADTIDVDFDIQHEVFKILDREGFVRYVRESFV